MSDVQRRERRERLGELFERAIGLPAEEQAAYVEEACGDDEALRAELASLVASYAAAPDFLDGMGARDRRRAEAPPVARRGESASGAPDP